MILYRYKGRRLFNKLFTFHPQPRCVWAIWAWIRERQGVVVPHHALHGHPQGHKDGTVCSHILASTANSSKCCSGNGTGTKHVVTLSGLPQLSSSAAGTSVYLWDRREGASGRFMRANPLHQVIITFCYLCLSCHCRLEELATYAVITVIVDFLIFMSFYPAGLSLVIELMFNKVTREPPNALLKNSSIRFAL